METQKSEVENKEVASAGLYLRILSVGALLGLVLSKSEAASWDRVHKMFRFEEAHMYLIIGTGIGVAMIAMAILKKLHAPSIGGKPIVYQPKPYHKGIILGGMIFGAGWAITGACPGPIYTQIGGGEWFALITLAGALLGMFGYALLKPRLPH
jgi:uncharacterized membrane protein YedE/YeeE